MEHNYIKTDSDLNIKQMVVQQRNNNLDNVDNLDEIPEGPAVYAMCGRVNGQPVNPRYVGETNNLQQAVKKLFDKDEPAPENNACFKEFMLSIKTKELVYVLVPDATEAERKEKKSAWINQFHPECNEVLNKVH
jgi:hypothetical protein